MTQNGGSKACDDAGSERDAEFTRGREVAPLLLGELAECELVAEFIHSKLEAAA